MPNGSRWKLPEPCWVPSTAACGPRELAPLAAGLAAWTQVSSVPISASPLEVACTTLWLLPLFWPALPPKATSRVIVREVVLAKVSIQRVQLPGLESLMSRLMATPPSTIGAAVLNASSPSKASPKPRISSPFSRALGSLAGTPETRTRMPPKP